MEKIPMPRFLALAALALAACLVPALAVTLPMPAEAPILAGLRDYHAQVR